jgi:hypothetical protein
MEMNSGWLTGLLCQLMAPSHVSPCGVSSAKAVLLDCEQWNSTQEAAEYEYFLCSASASSWQCIHCAGNSTAMLNMTLHLLPLGGDHDVVWARIPNVIKSTSCSVGGFMNMFMDCSGPKSVNVTIKDAISTVVSGNESRSEEEFSVWEGGEWNKSATLREAVGEYVKCSLQSVLMNVDTGPGRAGDVSDWGTHHHDWSFLFVLVFIVAGGVGNILVCLAVCLDRRLQNVTNYFLLSLAIADLLVSLFVMPLGAIPGFLGKLPPRYFLTTAQNSDKEAIPSDIRQYFDPKTRLRMAGDKLNVPCDLDLLETFSDTLQHDYVECKHCHSYIQEAGSTSGFRQVVSSF